MSALSTKIQKGDRFLGDRVFFADSPARSPEERARLDGLAAAFRPMRVYQPDGFLVTPDRAHKLKVLFDAGASCTATSCSYRFSFGAQFGFSMSEAVTHAKHKLLAKQTLEAVCTVVPFSSPGVGATLLEAKA